MDFKLTASSEGKVQVWERAGCVFLVLLGLMCCVSEAGSRNAVRILLLLSAVAVAFLPAFRQRLRISLKLASGMAFLWFLLALSAFWGGNWEEAVGTASFSLGYTFLLVSIVPLMAGEKVWIHRIILALMASLFVNDLVVFREAWQGEFRASGIWKYWLDAAMAYSICLPVFLSLLLVDREFKYRWAAALSFISGWAALILTNSRGAWIGAAAGCLAVLFFARKTISRKKILGVCLVVICLLGAFSIAKPQQAQRLYSIVEFGSEKHPEGERLLIWTAAVQMIEDYPLTGVGLHNFHKFYQEHYLSPKSVEGALNHAHNNFLQIWAENGLVAFLVYTALNLYLFWLGWKNRKSLYGNMLFSMVLSFTIFGMTIYIVNQYGVMRIFYLCLGICLCGLRLEACGENDKIIGR